MHRDGIFRWTDAIDAGYLDKHVRQALRDGAISRVRQGAFVASDVWSAADERERYRLRGSAVMLSHGDRVALSHTSAAVEAGLWLLRPDLSRVHVTRLRPGPTYVARDVTNHRGRSTTDDLVRSSHVLHTSPLRAAMETASLSDVESGHVVLQSALALRHASIEDVVLRLEEMRHWPGKLGLQIVVRLLREGIESPGEARSFHLCWRYGLPEPVVQLEVREHGRLVGRVDFAWPEYGLMGEFDGLEKYGRLRREGESVADAVVREKLREDALRDVTGWTMARWIWRELDQGERLAARLRSRLDRRVGLRA